MTEIERTPSRALQRLHAIDEAAHRLLAGRQHVEHAAIPDGHVRPDLAAGRAERELDHLLGAVGEVDMRHLLEGDEDVAVRHPPGGEMAVRVELGCDHGTRPGEAAHPLEEVAFAVVIAVGDHGAVQAEDDDVDRQGGTELAENLVAQTFIGGAGNEAGRLGPGRRALDQGEALGAGAAAGDDHRRAAQRRGRRMLPRGGVETLLERGEIGRDRRKRVGLGGERSRKDAHPAVRQKKVLTASTTV